MSNLDHHIERDFDQGHCQRIRGRVLRRLRTHGVRTHWSDARRLAPLIMTHDIAAWFNDRFGDSWSEDLRQTPKGRRLIKQLIWLIEVRDGFRERRDIYEITRVNGAIWQTATAIKTIRNEERATGGISCPIS